MSLSGNESIQGHLETFSKSLNSSLPLGSCYHNYFHDESKFMNVSTTEKAKALECFKEKMATLGSLSPGEKESLQIEFCSEMEKVIEAHREKNEEMKKKYLDTRVKVFSGNYKEVFEALLVANPRINLNDADVFLQYRKAKTIYRLDEFKCYYSDTAFFEEKKNNLKEILDQLQTELLENLKIRLEDVVETSVSLEEMKSTLLGILNEFRSSHGSQEQVLRQDIKDLILKMETYWMEKSTDVMVKYPKMYADILMKVKGSMKAEWFPEVGEYVSQQDVVWWASRVEGVIKYNFAQNEEIETCAQENNDSHGSDDLVSASVETNVDEIVQSPNDLEADLECVAMTMSSLVLNDGDCDNGRDFESGVLATLPQSEANGIVNAQANPENDQQSDFLQPYLANAAGEDEPIPSPESLHNLPTSTSAIASPISMRVGRMLRIPLEEIADVPDINLPDGNGEYHLLRAIRKGESVTCVGKMLESGANANIKTNDAAKRNAAIEVIRSLINEMMKLKRALDTLDCLVEHGFNLINDKDTGGLTALHYTLEIKSLDEQILLWMINNGADWGVVSDQGFTPLVHGVKYGQGNPFPTLMKLKSLVPITQEIASATLTAIVKEIERFRRLLTYTSWSQDTGKDFTQFFLFLTEERKAVLLLKDKNMWNEQNWKGLEESILKRRLLEELRSRSGINLDGEITQITPSLLGKLDFHAATDRVTVPIEVVLAVLLVTKKYKTFVRACNMCVKSMDLN